MSLQEHPKPHIPKLAFGLYKVSRTECSQVVQNAIKVGYRHFDCAPSYENEKEFGVGLQAALHSQDIKRSDLFICSKVWKDSVRAGREAVRRSIEKSIEDLGCTYLDLAMIHWPVPTSHVEAYKELEVLVKEGKILSLGLSNYHEKDYEEILAANVSILPVVNQMQISPFMYRPQLIESFTKRGIQIASHKSLHRGDFLDNDVIEALASKYSKSPAQIMIKWGLQKNFIVITKTSSLDRMKQNRDIFDFSLSSEDVGKLDNLTNEEEILIRFKHEMKSRED